MPTADPSCKAELKIAPTVPAADDGVEAKIAILIKKRSELGYWTKDMQENLHRVAVQDHTTDRTDRKGGEAESPVRIRRIGEW